MRTLASNKITKSLACNNFSDISIVYDTSSVAFGALHFAYQRCPQETIQSSTSQFTGLTQFLFGVENGTKVFYNWSPAGAAAGGTASFTINGTDQITIPECWGGGYLIFENGIFQTQEYLFPSDGLGGSPTTTCDVTVTINDIQNATAVRIFNYFGIGNTSFLADLGGGIYDGPVVNFTVGKCETFYLALFPVTVGIDAIADITVSTTCGGPVPDKNFLIGSASNPDLPGVVAFNVFNLFSAEQ